MPRMWWYEEAPESPERVNVIRTDGVYIGTIRRVTYMNQVYWTPCQYVVSSDRLYWRKDSAASELYQHHKRRGE